jgi:hypothetical protein
MPSPKKGGSSSAAASRVRSTSTTTRSTGRGRRYFVERGFESKAELAVLIADYRREAQRLGACPMSREAIERGFELAALA